MKRRLSGLRVIGLLVLFGCGALDCFAAERPNVLLILTDDQGFGDVTSHGNSSIRTPSQDQLARSGARFDRFFVSPVCAPTRASLLTGRYALRTGVHWVTGGGETMRAEELTLAEVLRGAGYATGAFGKWHNGRHMPNHPNGQGFDQFIGFCGGHWNRYFNANLEHNGKPIKTQGYIADVLTDAAIHFMESQTDRPWFCYVPFNTPHSPWRVPDVFWNSLEQKDLDDTTRCAYAMVENIDHNIGRLLKQLDRQGVADNTIVLFLSDNGANSDRYNAGMKGRKGSVDEGGGRVPLFIRYPGVIAKGLVVDRIAAHIDLLPTILDFCQVKKPAGPKIDGISLVPLLVDKAQDWPDRMIFTDRFRAGQPLAQLKGAVRTERWRAVRQPRAVWRLYDMQADPGQKVDVAAEHPQVASRLSKGFDRWFAGTGADRLGYHPIPVGHPSRQVVELPASEAVLHPGHDQGIKYTGSANGWANCWIYSWTDENAFAHWKIRVLKAGKYRVELRYTLDAKNRGTELAVEIAGHTLRNKVKTLPSPSLLPKGDRVPSADRYQEKRHWGISRFGEVDLSAGVAEINLRSTRIPGQQSVEFKSVVLTRLAD